MNTKQKFIMRVCNKLLIKLRMCGVDPSESAVFFGAQAQAMLDCKPNFGPQSKKVTVAKSHQVKKDVWLMRGFFPETPQMFKISISQNDAWPDFEYYVKVSEPTIHIPTKFVKEVTKRNESQFFSNDIKEQLQNRLEKEVLGLDLNIDPIISNKVVFTPKCMSPKGMPVHRLTYKKG
jgi:hypothetical protein